MRKKIILSLPIFFTLLVTSCHRDSSEVNSGNNGISAENFKKYNQNAEGNVFISLDEYFDQPVTLTSATFSATFKKDSFLSNVGDIIIKDKYKLERNQANNYLLNHGIDAKELLNNPLNVEIKARGSIFSTTNIAVQVNNNFNVQTNIGLEGIFRKNQDLVIKWTPRNKVGGLSLRSAEKMYLGIAASGVGPISREIPDNGEVTISSSELSSLPTNSQAVIRLGRVSQNCTTSNGKTVCVNVINNASSGPLVIQ